MNVTDWDQWMKDNHVKVYTEEELRKKKMMETMKKSAKTAKKYWKNHKEVILKGLTEFKPL